MDRHDHGMKARIKKLEKALTSLSPAAAPRFLPGASPDELKKLESLIGTKLPADVRKFFLCANGQHQRAPMVFRGYRMGRIRDMADGWRFATEEAKSGGYENRKVVSDPEVKADFLNRMWLHLTGDESGNSYCLDLDPTDEGTRGQIIDVSNDPVERSVVADSFSEWIDDLCEGIADGEYEYDEENRWLMPQE